MGSEAAVVAGGRASSIEIQISTDHPICQTETRYCTIHMPWGDYRVPQIYGEWHPIEIFIPSRFRQADDTPIRITTEDHWFPLAEGISMDRRCLGILIRAE